MIIDITGTVLIPGNWGNDCPGNGIGKNPLCCDECDYLMCCTETNDMGACKACTDQNCPHAGVGEDALQRGADAIMAKF